MKFTKYLAAAAMAMMTIGCAKEQTSSEIPDGQEINVTFNATLPDGIKTRANIGDGTTANQLVVAVYDNTTGKELSSLRQTKNDIALKTTVEFNLVKGKTYSFVFWAQAKDNTYYNIDDLRNIIIDYTGKDANDETRDAFYATKMDMKVEGAMNVNVTLRRPFSQVNFGTADFDDAKAAGFEPTLSSFTATAAATVFDPVNGEGRNGIGITLGAKELPAGGLKVKIAGVENTYKWVTMNYFIPEGKVGEKQVSDVTATFTTADNQTVTISAPNAPVQGNYRTNILGRLLTDQTIFNVVIEPAFNKLTPDTPDYNVTTVASQKGLNDAIEGATKGQPVTVSLPANSTFTLDNGIANEGSKSRDITFVGDGTQTFDVVSNAVTAEGGELNYQRGSSFAFKNMIIKAGEGSFDGIVCDELTYENCTIKGKLTLYGKATFVNCVFDNTMADQYSIWTWGGTDVKFDGCEFNTNGKAILLYGQATKANPTNLTVRNCKFNDRNNGTAGKAAIEIGNDYNATYTLNVSGCTVNGFADGMNTGSKIWANKNSMDAAHLSVTIDGTKVQ